MSSVIVNTLPTELGVNQAFVPMRRESSFFTMNFINSSTTKEQLKKITSVLKDWKEIIHMRSNVSRRKLQSSKLSQESIEYQTLKNQTISDLQEKDRYIDLLSNVTSPMQSLLQKKILDDNLIINVLYDDEENIQAVSTSRIKEDHIYVNNLLSAPWNVRMYAPIEEDHRRLAVKFGGSSLLRGIYEIAQRCFLPQVRLSPLEGSYDFYMYMGMKLKEKEGISYFYYDVNSDLPPALLNKSKEVLCG